MFAFMWSSVDSFLATGRSPTKVLSPVYSYMIKKLKQRPKFITGSSAHRAVDERFLAFQQEIYSAQRYCLFLNSIEMVRPPSHFPKARFM
jgi:hypothetical protein